MGDTYGSASVTIESYSKPNLITAILNVTNRQIDVHLHSLVYWAEKCFLVSVWNVQYYKAVCSLGATWAIHAYLIKLQKCLVTATEYCHFVWVLFFALLMGCVCVCTGGMNASCVLPQVGYCFYYEVREDVVSNVPEDNLRYWLRNYLGLSIKGTCVLGFNMFSMQLLNVDFHSIFCWNVECQGYLQRTYG